MKRLQAFRAPLAAFLLMVGMSCLTTALSFFITPVCEALDLGRGSFTIYYSLMTAAGAFSTTFLGQHINRKGVRGVILVSALWCGSGLMLFSLSTGLWMFYAVGFLTGLLGSACLSLCANVIVQQACNSAQASSVLGIVMAGSGVGGMVFSMILPELIETAGWRMGYRFLAACWLVLTVSAFLLLGKQDLSGAVGNRSMMLHGMSRKDAMKSSKFYLLLSSGVILTGSCGIQQQLPSLLSGMDFSTGQVSVMITVMTAALAMGKIIQGSIYSRIGLRHGSKIMIVIFAASFLLLRQRALVYPGLICLALGMGIVTTLMPTVARFAFGPREFASIWSIFSMVSSVSSFLMTPMWGIVYDATGSYDLCMLTMPVLLVISLITMSLALRQEEGHI